MITLLVLLVGLLPAGAGKNRALARLCPGSTIAPSARVAPVVLWRVHRLRLGTNAGLAGGTVVSGLRLVDLGADASIGRFNRFTAPAAAETDTEWAATLVLEARSALGSRYAADCSTGLWVAPGVRVAPAARLLADPAQRPPAVVVPRPRDRRHDDAGADRTTHGRPSSAVGATTDGGGS